MLARKHEVLRQVTKPLNDRVLFEETEMHYTNPFLFQLELLTFVLKFFVIHFEVFYNVRRLLSIAFVMPNTTLLC